MADFTQVEKINLSLKAIFGVQGTWNPDAPNGFHWSQEEYAYQQWVLNDEIIMNEIPRANTYTEALANMSANTALIEEVELKLSVVPGTNGRAWAAFKTYGDKDSGTNSDWLQPQLFGRGYALRLYQDNGTHNDSIPTSGAPGDEIATTIGAWIPNFKAGFIILGDSNTADAMGWTSPLWVKVFRYIGPKGVSGATAGVSLDDAYINGSIINVNNGPVNFDADNGYAPIQITPDTSAPTQGLAEGQLTLVDGITYQYDSTRNKWLSINREFVSFTSRFGCGNFLSSDKHGGINVGFMALRDGTLTGLTSIVGWGTQNKTFHIMKNGVYSSIQSFTMIGGKLLDDTLSIDIDAGDTLQVYFEPGPQAVSPRVNLEIAWRL